MLWPCRVARRVNRNQVSAVNITDKPVGRFERDTKLEQTVIVSLIIHDAIGMEKITSAQGTMIIVNEQRVQIDNNILDN